MKLTDELKRRIDEYFDNISPEDLLNLSVNKYGFTEDITIDIDDLKFATIERNIYESQCDEGISLIDAETYIHAA